MNELLLIEQAIAGNKNALGLVIKSFEGFAYYFISQVIKDKPRQDDIYQDCIVKLIGSIGTLKDPRGFKQWYRVMLKNTAINLVERKHSNNHYEFEDTIEAEDCMESNLIRQCRMKRIKSAASRLPPKQRLVITYLLNNDETMAEAARKLELNYDSLKTNYRLGLIKIKEELIE